MLPLRLCLQFGAILMLSDAAALTRRNRLTAPYFISRDARFSFFFFFFLFVARLSLRLQEPAPPPPCFCASHRMVSLRALPALGALALLAIMAVTGQYAHADAVAAAAARLCEFASIRHPPRPA